MEIDLSNQGIYDFPREYCFQKDIVSLILENNNLTNLPKEIVNLRSLKKLNLLNNNIIFNTHQEKWVKQLKENGCLIYIDDEYNIPAKTKTYTAEFKVNSVPKDVNKQIDRKSSLKARVHDVVVEQAKSIKESKSNILEEVIYDENGFDKDWNHRTTGTRYDENGFNKDGTIHKDTSLPKDKYGHRRNFYKLKTVLKPIEKPKSNPNKKEEILKIVNVKVPEQKGLRIVKKRFDDIEIDIPNIKSILPINDMYNQRKIILIYAQEKYFLNLTLIEYHNNEFVIIDNIFKDGYGLSEITNIIQEFIYDEIEDECGLSMSNLKASNLDGISFEDNKLKVSEASVKTINILKDEEETVIIIENLVLEDHSSVNLSFELTKNEFNDEIINFRKNALDFVKTIIINNNYTADNIDYIIGNEEALSISSITNSLELTFGKDVFPFSEKIIYTGTVENKGIK